MAKTIQEGVTAVNDLITKVNTLITETTNAENRLEAKIATLTAQVSDLQAQVTAGSDATAIVDAATTESGSVDNAIASQQVTGV